MELFFHESVGQEIGEILDYLDKVSNQAGDRFLDALDFGIEFIGRNPDVGHPVGRFRRWNLRRLPYHVLYDVRPEGEIWMMVIKHDAQHPDFGMEREISKNLL